MKICHKCNRRFPDDDLYCLYDGSDLVSDSTLRPPVPLASGESQVQFPITLSQPIGNSASKTSPLLFMLIGVLGTALFGVIFYVFLLSDKSNETDSPQRIENASANVPPRVASPANSVPQPTASAKSHEEIQSEIKKVIAAWENASESRDVNVYMGYYADVLGYYNKASASKAFVRADKQKAFSKFPIVSVDITNEKISVNPDGRDAEAQFDKEWTFSGECEFSGKVRQQLRFRKFNDRWLIVSEKELKVYYVNKCR